ncbi:tRNA-uridine aminocarboxypropyltransferase [Pseudoteredinibacter isoporae]|uniref:tRNA-uridine aminocarboxypropyltransferase n=1 Tax=Pseudoteredinibacter isoporae TaxID=570281 RepID=A0A7X0MW91_9GAMM|nr:tRNA-uridine aminocarboxypropyltransferase [Pseudoteredinibacter isoporae]MBB6522213.1 DTW domain-containing protein YfiP [Pseudoteredinibacter isoporae]NHO87747.1 DTW domain-containing protein [Pseudoteredinibacter isoporae]NIB23922.1 DTW domain-containing protein [Pseudoteredinibacter isoporae]
MTEKPQKRASCPQCHRPLRSCLCDLITTVDNQVHIQLLQHPGESQHPKGSAILLQLSLHHVTTWIGEQFPELEPAIKSSTFQDVLLYPENNESNCSQAFEHSTNDARPLRLWVLDGTWRKTYKMLQLNPALQNLPRFTPNPEQTSQYRIRKAPKDGQLSTLEACCHALSELEHSQEKYRPLLSSFDQFNQRWMSFQQSSK